MDPNSGKIRQFTSDAGAKAAGYTVKLTEDESTKLLSVPEYERMRLLKLIWREDREHAAKTWRSRSKKQRAKRKRGLLRQRDSEITERERRNEEHSAKPLGVGHR